jgi:hypothetical protein
MEQNKTCGIYCIENLSTGQKYIGQSKNIENRIKNHITTLKHNNNSNKILQNSWNVSGQENFDVFILKEFKEKDLDFFEKFYIHEYKTIIEEFGFNRTHGGKKYIFTDIVLEEIINSKTMSEGRPIISIDIKTGIIGHYASTRGICRNKRYDQGALLDALTKRRPTAYNKIWFYENEYIKIKSDFLIKDYLLKSHVSKAILQFDLEGKFLKKWDTPTHTRTGGFDISAVVKCCKRKCKSHKNYQWRYEIDNEIDITINF